MMFDIVNYFEPENYFEPWAGKMSLAHIDPSLALGFYCDDKNDFEDLIRYIQSIVCVYV